MSISWRVAEDMWLGLTRSGPAPPGLPRWRRLVDWAAATAAERAALSASGLRADDYAVSRSHTEGIGAAVVAPARIRVGVDLVFADRVRERHAAGILTRAEWWALEPYAPIRPALAWALKEAAAKATGEPLRDFPDGLRIEVGSGGVVVRIEQVPRACCVARWVCLGSLLCVWVRQRSRDPVPSVTSDRPAGSKA